MNRIKAAAITCITWIKKAISFLRNEFGIAAWKEQCTMQNVKNWGWHILGGWLQGFTMSFNDMQNPAAYYFVVGVTVTSLEIDQYNNHDKELKLLDRILDVISWMIGCAAGHLIGIAFRYLPNNWHF